MNIDEAKHFAVNHGWRQSLGFSKRTLGIKTKKDPQHRNRARAAKKKHYKY